MTREYKYVISLEGERYLVCYNEIENDITTEVIKDIDTTPGDTEEGLRQVYITLLHEALDNTNPQLNHTKTIEYVKNDYVSRLDKLYDVYFEHQAFTVDNHKFNISNRSLHYYRQIEKDIESGKSKLEILNFATKEVTWYDKQISFENYLNYMNDIILYIAKLNKDFSNDKKYIININPEVDFSNYIDTEIEMAMFMEARNKQKQDGILLINDIKAEIFSEFDEKTDEPWQTIMNLCNPANVDVLQELSTKGRELVKKYTILHQIHIDEFEKIRTIISNKKPKHILTQERLDKIILKWSAR